MDNNRVKARFETILRTDSFSSGFLGDDSRCDFKLIVENELTGHDVNGIYILLHSLLRRFTPSINGGFLIEEK